MDPTSNNQEPPWRRVTPTDEDREWVYRYEERLGILAQGDKPTPDQIRLAKEQAGRGSP